MSVVVWLTGLPSSGKTTLARHVAERLRAEGCAACLLDSDEVRAALVPAPGYDDAGRDAFYETLAQLAALLAKQGIVALVPATANRRRYRERARAVAPAFVEVYVSTPADVCEARDAKGLYAAARDGNVASLPGSGADYEPPTSPDVLAPAGDSDEAVAAIVRLIVKGSAP